MEQKDYSKEINEIIKTIKYPFGKNVTIVSFYIKNKGNAMSCSATYKNNKFEVTAVFRDIEPLLATTPISILINQACLDMYFRLQDELCNKITGKGE